MLVAQSRQKSYTDVSSRDIEFGEGDELHLRVWPSKGVVRLGTKRKFSPRYIGPFLVKKCVGKLEYQLELP